MVHLIVFKTQNLPVAQWVRIYKALLWVLLELILTAFLGSTEQRLFHLQMKTEGVDCVGYSPSLEHSPSPLVGADTNKRGQMCLVSLGCRNPLTQARLAV